MEKLETKVENQEKPQEFREDLEQERQILRNDANPALKMTGYGAFIVATGYLIYRLSESLGSSGILSFLP